jgi:hypothetical protein
MNYSLYEIDEDLRNLLEQAQEFDSETPSEDVDNWLANFEETKGERAKKMEAIARVRFGAMNGAHSIDNEIARLMEIKKKDLRLAEKMENLLERTMRNAGDSEIKTDLFRAKFVKNPPKLILTPELEKSFMLGVFEAEEQLKAERGIASEFKKKVKSELKAGETVDGARLEQTERLKIE